MKLEKLGWCWCSSSRDDGMTRGGDDGWGFLNWSDGLVFIIWSFGSFVRLLMNDDDDGTGLHLLRLSVSLDSLSLSRLSLSLGSLSLYTMCVFLTVDYTPIALASATQQTRNDESRHHQHWTNGVKTNKTWNWSWQCFKHDALICPWRTLHNLNLAAISNLIC